MLLTPIRLVSRVVHRYRTERCGQTAAALAFTTVLGLVPMVAGAVALISILPFGSGLGAAVQKFLLANLLPDKAGIVITKYVTQFASKAVRLTWIGALTLAVTAMLQMLTIERTFNMIWRIRIPRPLYKRILLHATALLMGPVVFGIALVAVTYLITTSLGLLSDPGDWLAGFLMRALPFAFMVALFGLLYWGVPNRSIPKSHALFGGVFTGGCMLGIQKLLSIYVHYFSAQAMIYGTFVAVPIFLLWLYLSWTVILIGAYIVAELPQAE
ncbi:MAG: YihY family inner membrane protein [Rhodocyclaceae bacterium]|nr:YihY family inner membrane protein [Rhodocyclaceae bacterium]